MKTAKLIPLMIRWCKSHPIIIFIGVFILHMVLFYAIYLNPWVIDHILTPWTNFNAKLASIVLNMLGSNTNVIGETISSSQFSVAVKLGCNGLSQWHFLWQLLFHFLLY
ncbi:MAG: archaeosortase/exosortase family protein [Bacteroidota bacterium]